MATVQERRQFRTQTRTASNPGAHSAFSPAAFGEAQSGDVIRGLERVIGPPLLAIGDVAPEHLFATMAGDAHHVRGRHARIEHPSKRRVAPAVRMHVRYAGTPAPLLEHLLPTGNRERAELPDPEVRVRIVAAAQKVERERLFRFGQQRYRALASALAHYADIALRRPALLHVGLAELHQLTHAQAGVEQSEERRVGKECRSRWSP